MANNSKQYFRIEGEAVHLITERIERTVRLSDLVGEVSKETGITTPVLPLGCRFFSARNGHSTFVIEQAPVVRAITWYGMGEKERWKLAFPYVIFVLSFRDGNGLSGSKIFYRIQPVETFDDMLLSTNMGNTNLNGQLCTGNMRVNGETQAQKAESFVGEFWRSAWNTDINESWNTHQHIKGVSSLTMWEEESAKNPFFPLSIKWQKYGCLRDVIEGRC